MTKQKAPRRWPARIAWLFSWAALAVALVGWLGLTALADRNGMGTLIAFGPSWLMVVPAALSIPFALWGDRRALIPLAWAGLVVAWPVMGWNFPWRALTAETTPEDLSLRLLTINKGMVKTFDPIALRNLIIEREAQVVLMQEASGMTLEQLRLGEEWTLKANGELVVISRLPIDRVEALTGTEHDGKAAALRCDIRTPKGTVHVIAIHLRSAREGITAAIKHGPFQYGVIGSNLQERSATSLAVAEWVAGIPMMEPGPVVVGGDFNLPPASALLARHWGWLRDSHLDAGWGWGLTWFSSWHGLRIDHLMADPEARWTWSEVGPNVGSDHRPLLAEVHWTAPN